MKRLLLFILLGLIAGGLFTFFYDSTLDPGANYFARAAEKTDSWEAALRAESGAPCYVFAGGSEVRMCLDPKIMKDEYGVRVLNAGGMAGYGIRCNAVLGVDYLRPGDTLVLSMRGTLLGEDDGMTTSGLKFCYRRLGLRMFDSGLIEMNASNLKQIFVGRAGDLSMYIAKNLFRPDDVYKYDTNTKLHESGWCENFYKHEYMHMNYFTPGGDVKVVMNDALRNFLMQLKAACEAKGARLAIYMSPERLNTHCAIPASFIACEYMKLGIPVLRDPTFGCVQDMQYISDRPNHLSPEGTRKYSRIYAEALRRSNPFWTFEELEALQHAYGYAADGRYHGGM